jgi:hypothetical protein
MHVIPFGFYIRAARAKRCSDTRGALDQARALALFVVIGKKQRLGGVKCRGEMARGVLVLRRVAACVVGSFELHGVAGRDVKTLGKRG